MTTEKIAIKRGPGKQACNEPGESNSCKQHIERLLELQEHAEQVTDEQLQQLLADPQMRQLVQQLGLAKRALFSEELKAKREELSVDDEWEKFAASHAEALDALSENEKENLSLVTCHLSPVTCHLSPVTCHLSLVKIAASFIGLLFVSGIAFAALQIARSGRGDFKSPAQEVRIPNSRQPAVLADTIKADTLPVEPRIFDNVTLDTMLSEISAAHHVGMEFQNEDARQLRFHFVWKREDSLDRVVEKLNTFEAVNIIVENDKLIVR